MRAVDPFYDTDVVLYLLAFADFFSPVLNVAKGGQSLPRTFRLTDANGVPSADLASVTAWEVPQRKPKGPTHYCGQQTPSPACL